LLVALAHAALGLIGHGASSIVLSGAVLCGYGPALQARLPASVLVLDAVQCAVRHALALVDARWRW
jgi:allantoin racemase